MTDRGNQENGEIIMTELKDGCVKPARGPIIVESETHGAPLSQSPFQEVVKMQARVGKEAPDFEANAFMTGEGFKPIRLSDYKSQWLVLCFYPGDFTFV
jgi:peroxiredoxin (alkyl hydroperoxide reductase subunit C)